MYFIKMVRGTLNFSECSRKISPERYVSGYMEYSEDEAFKECT